MPRPPTAKASSPSSAATRPPPASANGSECCGCSSRTFSSAPRRSPSATASPSGNEPRAAAATKTPTRRVTCTRVIHCVGGVLSPILSNIMLDDLDRELWQRGHRFVRYADDLRVFVRSERAAQRVFESVCGVIERRLKLKVNREKSSIRHAAEAMLLGFGFVLTGPQVTIRVAPKAVRRLKDQLRVLTRRSWGVWMAYLRLADAERMFRSLDGWLRRRLRQVRWKEWKATAAKRHNLRIRGISESDARKWGGSSKGYWRVAGSKVLQVSLPNTYWNRLGLKTLSQTWQRLNPTA